jgi:hypothetical protein
MKLNGQKVSGPNEVVVVIPRPEVKVSKEGEEPTYVSGDHIFRCKAVLDYDVFDKLCPRPEAPVVLYPGGRKAANPEDKGFKERLAHYGVLRFAWMVITSLSATPNLEWDKVLADKPDSWPKYEEELKESGFSQIEVGRITNGVLEANCLDETKLDEARKRFFAQAAPQPAR